jgi:hypothetical protein
MARPSSDGQKKNKKGEKRMRALTLEEANLVAGASPQGDLMIGVGTAMIAAGRTVRSFPHPYAKMAGTAMMTTGSGLVALGDAHNRQSPGSSPNPPPPSGGGGGGPYPAPPSGPDCDESNGDGPGGAYIVFCNPGSGGGGGTR